MRMASSLEVRCVGVGLLFGLRRVCPLPSPPPLCKGGSNGVGGGCDFGNAMFEVGAAWFYGAGCRSLAPDDMPEENSANCRFRGIQDRQIWSTPERITLHGCERASV